MQAKPENWRLESIWKQPIYASRWLATLTVSNQLLTPTLSSLKEERETFFVGWLPGVARSSQPRADFFCPVGARQSELAPHFHLAPA
jgi:hypothetical protein